MKIQEIWHNFKLLIFFILVSLIAISLAISSGWFFYINKELENQNKSLAKSETICKNDLMVSKERATISDKKNTSLNKLNNDLVDLVGSMNTELEFLDELIRDDNSENIKFISWLRDNSNFTIADGTYALAVSKYDSWSNKLEARTEQYKNVRIMMDGSLLQINQIISDLKKGQSLSY